MSDHKNQKQRILELLMRRGLEGVTNVELNHFVCFAYSQRIGELKRDGEDIESVHEGGSVWRYFWRGKKAAMQKQLFESVA